MKYIKLLLAGCVILNQKGEVLLLHRRAKIRDQWETPGGKIENGEEPKRAAEREVEEELGIDIKILKKLGIKDFVEDEYIMNYTWYQAEINSGTPRIVEKEKFDDLKYFSWNKLHKIKDQLSPNTHNLVEAFFSNNIELV